MGFRKLPENGEATYVSGSICGIKERAYDYRITQMISHNVKAQSSLTPLDIAQ